MSDHSRTLEEVKDFILTRETTNAKDTIDFYDTWAEAYEKDSEKMNYRAPKLVVDFLNANYSKKNREDVQVLDVACGSGLVAKLMSEQGFKHFVGVDGSKNMMALATETKLYKDLRLALLGTEKLPAENGMYDLVVIVGALRHEHVPVSVIRELCHATKPGGYVCMSRVELNLEVGAKYKECMEQELRLMEEEGLWSCVTTEEMINYMIEIYNKENDKYRIGTIYFYRKSLI